MRKSCTRTVSGWPVGRQVRPAFLKSPTNSFFFVSTEITGWPAAWNWRTCAAMWRNWASRSGGGGPSRALRLACKLYPAALKSSRTSWWLTRWPMLWRVRARVRVLFAVQRSGESGAPAEGARLGRGPHTTRPLRQRRRQRPVFRPTTPEVHSCESTLRSLRLRHLLSYVALAQL